MVSTWAEWGILSALTTTSYGWRRYRISSATKLKVRLERVAARDYVDIAAILRTGASLEDGLGAAAALYGSQFPPMEAVKALAWSEVGDARNVDPATRECLSRAAAGWDCTISAITRVEELRLGP